MNSSFTPAGRFHSPFRIFIRDLKSIQYGDLIDSFHLQRYTAKTPHSMHRQLAIVPLDDWTMLADDWFYTLWHMPTTMQVIEDAAKRGDIYYDLVGDCDESYAFGYFHSGSIVRKVAVASPHFSDQVLETDDGSPFSVESRDRMTNDIEGYVDSIAQFIGIRLPSLGDEVFAFGPSPNMG